MHKRCSVQITVGWLCVFSRGLVVCAFFEGTALLYISCMYYLLVVCLDERTHFAKTKEIDFDKMFGLKGVKSVKGFGEWEDNVDSEPLENGNISFGEFALVGHGKVTNERCGTFSSKFYGCLNVDLHNKTVFDKNGNMVDCRGKVFIKPVFHSCDKPSCPICFKMGWAVREAQSVEVRLFEASKRFGLVEHIVCSVPSKDYGLDYEALRKKAVKVLSKRGVAGGCLIFHGFRFDKQKWVWYWSPHFHVLGFIFGGYARCRNCNRKSNCLKGCGGFDDRNYHEGYLKDGWVVKVLDKRKTVGGTAWYQLNHSSVKIGVKRFHVATWFGICSYRKLKVTTEYKKSVCPICQHDLVKVRYHGRFMDRWVAYGGAFFADFEEDTVLVTSPKEVVWEVVDSDSHKYRGGY